MAKISVQKTDAIHDDEGYLVPTCDVTGNAKSRKASPDGYSIWLYSGDLDEGTTLHWSAGEHGDEAVYVHSGSLKVDGREVPTGGVLIVESGADVTAEAAEDASVFHFGSEVPPANKGAGEDWRGYHIIGPKGIYGREKPDGNHQTRIFADASCPTCDIQFHFSARHTPYRSAAHHHTCDELIFMLGGDIRLGSYHLDPGESVAIPANIRYRFETGDDGYVFLNFSPGKSEYVAAPGEPVRPAAASPMVLTGDGADYTQARQSATGG
jgi:quercetin dioxygenase-like cupin family protein